MISKNITLSKTVVSDLDTLFEFQLDREANYLAAFTAKDPTDKLAYLEKYSKHILDPTINMQTIRSENRIVGSLAKFMMEGEAEITYWIDRKFWGNGIATIALKTFLNIEKSRPIYARTVYDNYGSQRVLVKCSFLKIGIDQGYANAREAEVEEFIYRLSG